MRFRRRGASKNRVPTQSMGTGNSDFAVLLLRFLRRRPRSRYTLRTMLCPRCSVGLTQATIDEGVFFRSAHSATAERWAWHCCGGRGRSGASASFGGRHMTESRSQRGPCPVCGRAMAEVAAAGPQFFAAAAVWTFAPLCEFVWFDPREFDLIPTAPVDRPEQLPREGQGG